MVRRIVALFAIVAAECVAFPALAQSPDDARALELFDASERAYKDGRFQEAIDFLKQSYALKREPVVLYNLARAYEGLGDLDQAAHAYEDYLRAQPDASDKGSIEQRIATLKRTIAERDAARARAVRPPPKKPSALPWITAGVGVAGIGAGAILGVLSRKRHDDAVAEPHQLDAEADQRSASSLATAANIAFIAGGVLAVAGVGWGIVDLRATTSGGATSLVLRVQLQ